MNDDEFRDLIERAHQIREVTNSTGWDYLVDRAHVTMAAKQRKLISGGVASMEEYKTVSGWLAGADFVLNLADMVEAEVRGERENRADRERAAEDDGA